MDYEKKYKEALERARNLHKDAIDMGENIRAKQCEIIFPELKENEDERIRIALIRFHKSTIDIDGIKGADVIAWLEKQGEKKSVTIDIDKMVSKYSHTKDGDFGLPVMCQLRSYRQGINDCATEILSFLETLEVKEVNLDGEINLWVRNLHRVPSFEELNKFARHFFELGLKAQIGE